MEEKEILTNLACLRSIKPKEEWVLLTKNKIIREEVGHMSHPFHFQFPLALLKETLLVFDYWRKPALLIPTLAFFVAVGIIGQQISHSVPGDTFYPLRSNIERVQFTVSQADKSFQQIELAQKRLQDLKTVVEKNKTANLIPSIKEFEVSIGQVSKGLVELVENEPDKALQASREVLQLQQEKEQIEQVLGTTIGEEESGELLLATKTLVENELADLESRTLNEQQQLLFEEAKTAYQENDYATALEKIWMLSNQ